MNEDKGTRYRRLERRLLLIEIAAAAAALLSLACSAAPVRVRAAVQALGETMAIPPGPASTVVTAAALLAIGLLTPALAAGPAAWVRQRHLAPRFGLPEITTATWVRAQARPGLVLVVVGAPCWVLFAHLAAWSPWLAGLLTSVSLLVVAGVVTLAAPWIVTFSPRVRPIADEALTGRVHALTMRAGIRVAGMHAWRLGRDGSDANAAIVGVFGGRRLLLSDNLIATCTAEEIEAVVAHELGHHVHGHTRRRLGLQAVSGLAALLGAQAAAAGPAVWTGTGGLTDPASLPWMLIGAGAVWVGARPWRLTQSRRHEREADAYAVQMTRRPEVLERVLARLGARTLTSDDDSLLARAFFLTHPPIAARIALARDAGARTRS
ncbi:MAG: M48 family metalloprotease [Luteitalea sp.]